MDYHRIEKVLALAQVRQRFGLETKASTSKIHTLFVVSMALQAVESTGERNKAWIDCGMFAMSVVHALHSCGLGTCCLNWSAGRKQDQKVA